MNIFHSLCPICNTTSNGLCNVCESLILQEVKGSYMKKVCPFCGKHLISPISICSCDNNHFHYTIFDNTIIIKTLIQSMKKKTNRAFVTQIGNIILHELTLIDPACSFSLYHDETKSPYSHFFDLLVLYVNRSLNIRSGEMICLCVKYDKKKRYKKICSCI